MRLIHVMIATVLRATVILAAFIDITLAIDHSPWETIRTRWVAVMGGTGLPVID